MRLSGELGQLVIGGANGTSNVRAGKLFDIPVLGTHAHALVQVYGNDYEAFKAYAQPTKLVSSLWIPMIPFASVYQLPFRLRVNWVTRLTFLGVRIDSGDIAYISKKVRQQLDEAGFTEAKIYASNDLMKIPSSTSRCKRPRLMSGVCGTKLITAYDQPALGQFIRLLPLKMKMVTCAIPLSCQIMLKKFQHQVRSKCGALPVVKRQVRRRLHHL